MESFQTDKGTRQDDRLGRSPMDHVRALAEEIGPRGSTGPGEARAAEYVMGEFERMGLAPERLPFRSPVSAWRPFAILSGVGLFADLWIVGFSITDFAIPSNIAPVFILSIFLNALALYASVRQLITFKTSVSAGAIKHGESANVLAKVSATSPHEKTNRVILITSHYDTHRTPLAYSSPFWVKVFRSLTALGMGTYALGILLGVVLLFVDSASPPGLAIGLSAILPALVQLGILALTLQADMTPYTPGANDNASGVAALLGVGERLAARPLESTEVWLLATGCEEVGLIGMREFMRQRGPKSSHPERLPRPEEAAVYQINIDNIGGEGLGPRYIDGEKMLVNFRSDPGLLAIADKITAERPDLDARRMSYQGAYTDGAIGVINGLRVITFLGLNDDGWIPNLHQMSDTADKVDARAIERTVEFIEDLARRVDSGAAEGGVQ